MRKAESRIIPFLSKLCLPSKNEFDMGYRVCYLDEVVRKHIPLLPLSEKNLIKKAIEERLMVDPIGFGKPLRYSLKGHRRIRISDYRVVYRIEFEIQTVIIVAIKHRKDVY